MRERRGKASGNLCQQAHVGACCVRACTHIGPFPVIRRRPPSFGGRRGIILCVRLWRDPTRRELCLLLFILDVVLSLVLLLTPVPAQICPRCLLLLIQIAFELIHVMEISMHGHALPPPLLFIALPLRPFIGSQPLTVGDLPLEGRVARCSAR